MTEYRYDDVPEKYVFYEVNVAQTIAVPFAVGHLHVGGINISLSVDGAPVCTSYPAYGSEDGVPGSGRSYLVAMSPCVDVSQPYLVLKKGSVARVDPLPLLCGLARQPGSLLGRHASERGGLYVYGLQGHQDRGRGG